MYLLVQGPINPSDSPTQNASKFMKQIDTNFPVLTITTKLQDIKFIMFHYLNFMEKSEMSLAWLPAVSVQQV